MNPYKKVLICLLLDAIGLLSIIFPPFDFLWAPLSAFFMTKLFKGKQGKIAALVSFVEEALPMLDVVPTFTLMWLYTWATTTISNKTSIPS